MPGRLETSSASSPQVEGHPRHSGVLADAHFPYLDGAAASGGGAAQVTASAPGAQQHSRLADWRVGNDEFAGQLKVYHHTGIGAGTMQPLRDDRMSRILPAM